MEIESTSTNLPAFTLYPLSTHDLKTCYQSQHYKLICALNGPYFDRKHNQLAPLFNITLLNCSDTLASQPLTSSQINKYQQKLKEVISNVVLSSKYERMVFDINIEVIERHLASPPDFILAPLINLLSYTCMLKSLQIQSVFSCAAVGLVEGQLVWEGESGGANYGKQLIQGMDNRDKKCIVLIWEGEFNYVDYQKLSGVLLDANQQIARFLQEKVNQIYDIFHQ